MFDGIIKLFVNHMEGSSQYSMEISKLRNSTHKLSTVPYQITDSGFDVLSD
jgi:KaiC/GvpD/RAD55 family RecA-like ATPase